MPDDRYTAAKKRRDEHVSAILSSNAPKKVVVAGPGTGKTHLFKRILEGKRRALTLSFINALVDDLSVDLSGMSEVKTLHSFARDLLKRLWNKNEIRIFARLSDIVQEDLKLLEHEEIDFEKVFHTRDDENPRIEFYRGRKKYYDESYGYSDIVFAAVKFLEDHRDRVPTYEQVLVDEFQDFNPLEVSLIDLLAERSPMLIAGDDDQALYDFKHADPRHIRGLHAGEDYESFNLPMCSRCPRVVVEATNDIVKAAIANKLLDGRISKPYEYFDDEAKDRISDRYPQLTHKTLFAGQFAWYIGQELDQLMDDLRDRFSVLVISPMKVQAKTVAAALKKSGFLAVDFVDKAEQGITLFDGLRLLLKDKDSNLGWRIIAGLKLAPADLTALLTQTVGENPQPLNQILPGELKKETKAVLTALRRVRDAEAVTTEQVGLLEGWEIDPLGQGLERLGDDLNADSGTVRPGLRRLPIKVTTVQGSKGLAADVVFITHVDDLFFINKEGMNSKDVCNFLVALTRAKKRVYLLSSRQAKPTFVSWIAPGRIDSA